MAKRAAFVNPKTSMCKTTRAASSSRAWKLIVPVLAAIFLVYLYFWWATTERFSDQKKKAYIMAFVHMNGCGHCVTFQPTWKAFEAQHGDSLKKSRGITLMDLERKDWEAWRKSKGVQADIGGFPTVIMIDATSMSEVARFSAERTVDNLHAWALQVAV